MADSSTFTLKRLREDSFSQQQEEESKRHSKCSSYNQILSFLEEDEDEPNQDLSSLISSLQQEISSSSSEPQLQFATQPITRSEESDNGLAGFDSVQASSSSEEDDDNKERVIRHLLEASDDELGIPNGEVCGNDYGFDGINGGGGFELALCDGLWEFEDETANYYTLLQSELFL